MAKMGALALEVCRGESYCRPMKRIFLLTTVLALGFAAPVRAQDAATQQRLDELAGKIESLLERQDSLNKKLSEISREVDTLREQANAPKPTYASQDDLKRLSESVKSALKEADANRVSDYNRTKEYLDGIRKDVAKAAAAPPPVTPRHRDREKDTSSDTGKSTADKTSDNSTPDKTPYTGDYIEYTVKAGNTLSAIAQACREKGIKVTTAQILEANPGLKPEKVKEGQKIKIPVPKGTVASK